VAVRLVGASVLLLALSAIWPLPLVNVIPGAIVILTATAYLQEGDLLLAAAFLSLARLGWTVWTSAGACCGGSGIRRRPARTAHLAIASGKGRS
jgi:hypothetical protein